MGGELKEGRTSSNETVSYLFKIIIVGTESVGKTCFLKRFIDQTFSDSYLPTIGVDFCTKTFRTENGEVVKLQVWDTAGQERFRTITNSYYRGAQGVILMYDITKKATFDQIPTWLDQIEQHTVPERVLLIVGNKADGDESNRQVRREEGTKLASERNCTFFETSARADINVSNVFQALIEKLLTEHKENKQDLKSCTAPGPVGSTRRGPIKLFGSKRNSTGKQNKNSKCLL
ncbi:unnamed protein product [Lymnaea stagnalis]|uniref:Uncharacterized protein n=1 Tax=Lymnaea stagnalis TaxID=6523 RepID=A0AAV2I0Q4_LYMST